MNEALSQPNDTANRGLLPRDRMRPFFWSVRREIWENRSVYLAPAIVAVVQTLGFIVSLYGIADRRRAVLLLPLAEQRPRIQLPYTEAGMMMILTVFLVGIFYCLDALHGERRDRTILFWKSLPVSDLTTVLAKLAIPLLVLPMIAFVLVVCVQVVMFATSAVTLLAHGLPATSWSQLPLAFDWLVLFYGLAALSLWHAPIYAWLVLTSAWARRAAFLWAALPLIVINIFERIIFGTHHFGNFIANRMMGFAPHAFDFSSGHGVAINSLAQVTPGRYLTMPGVWLGLIVAAVLTVGAIQFRRYRGPL